MPPFLGSASDVGRLLSEDPLLDEELLPLNATCFVTRYLCDRANYAWPVLGASCILLGMALATTYLVYTTGNIISKEPAGDGSGQLALSVQPGCLINVLSQVLLNLQRTWLIRATHGENISWTDGLAFSCVRTRGCCRSIHKDLPKVLKEIAELMMQWRFVTACDSELQAFIRKLVAAALVVVESHVKRRREGLVLPLLCMPRHLAHPPRRLAHPPHRLAHPPHRREPLSPLRLESRADPFGSALALHRANDIVIALLNVKGVDEEICRLLIKNLHPLMR